MPQVTQSKYHLQPYHMNGLNWKVVPEDSTRDNIVIVTGFMPSWWTQEFGIRFGRDFHQDPQVHKSTLVKMTSVLAERFRDIPNFFHGGDDYVNSFPTERLYGDALIPTLFGSKVSFDDASGHPNSRLLNISDEEAINLKVPDVANHPVLRSMLDPRGSSDVPVTGELGFEGVVNIAYRLRGQEMFADLILNPDLIEHVFEVAYETIDTTVHHVRQWQDPGHTKPSYFVNCNCLINMMSGKAYADRLLPFDKRFHKSFDLFGIHTCNWSIDPYLDAIAEIGELAYLDMGADSDLDKVKRLFPKLAPSVFFHPEKLRRLTVKEITKEITELGKRLGKGYILFSDLEVGTTDSQIRAAYEAAARL